MIVLFNALLTFIIILFMGAIGLDLLEENLTLKTWITGIGAVVVACLRITL